MQNIEPIPFVHHLLAPPMTIPFGLSGCNISGAGRPQTASSWRPHEGIDLCPFGSPPNNSIYAVNWGTVESVENFNPSDWLITIRHHPDSSGVYTLYRHLTSVEPSIVPNAQVDAGEPIGSIAGFDHLHFIWAQKTDPADPFLDNVPDVNNPTGHGVEVRNRIPLDPTPLLYRFEAYRWPSGTSESDAVLRYQHESNYPYSKINRIRIISWPDRRAATWLMQVAMPDRNNPETDVEYFFLPINDALPHEKLMADVIRDSFHNGNRVRLRWRDSYFYGEPRKMIDDIRVRP